MGRELNCLSHWAKKINSVGRSDDCCLGCLIASNYCQPLAKMCAAIGGQYPNDVVLYSDVNLLEDLSDDYLNCYWLNVDIRFHRALDAVKQMKIAVIDSKSQLLIYYYYYYYYYLWAS